ncbi:hypothetical protein ACFW04_014242 [Cataglyphis niger]
MRRPVFFVVQNKGSKIKHHKFPLKDKKILQWWLQHMSLESSFVPKKHSLLCSDHLKKKIFSRKYK